FCEPLAELLEPKRGYEAVCEAALNGNMQTIIVDDWRTAFAALEFLQKNKLGRAGFMKNEISDLDIEEIALDDPLIKGNVIDYIRFDARYRSLFKRLLNGDFLVNSVDDGILVLNALPEDMQKKVRFITLKGGIVSKYKISGGSPARDFTSSIIGRRMRMKDIESHIATSEKELLKLKQELHVKRELVEDFQGKIKRVEDALRAEEIELTQKRSQESNLEKMKKKIQEEIDLVDLEMEESLLSQHELKDREAEQKAKLDETKNEEASLQCLIMDSQVFIEEGARKREEFLITITQIKTELASLRSQEDEFFKRAETQKNYYDEQAKILDEKKGSLEKTVHRQEELRGEIASLDVDIKQLTERYEIISKELKILEDESSNQKDIIDEKQGQLDSKKEDSSAIKDKVHTLEMEETQSSFQMESLRGKINQIYRIDLEATFPSLDGIEDPQAVQGEVDELSQRVEKMGPVNLVAIDEHKELEERFLFLKRQEEDLVSAKDALYNAIKKINRTTRQLFMDTFVNVQAEFKNYFRFLFGGGKAEIILLDEKDVLESGIEIIVRPPGKKLQTISLLSGGEKALTAIALLFAIFKTKPSPFCLLDEIDAPLDESNIGRFSKVLQDFTKKSQFIIVTHNKKTMNMSDIMYGITMERSGISKIISVKFADKAREEQPVVVA
ncbi:hypothetical protein OAA99_02840, partial [Omnitrophica bacterium]|nr:hypothetical protein [Candidatus Omnitrophota bacterium]